MEDLPTRVAWFNHPTVSAQMTLEIPMSLSETQQWYRGVLLNPRRKDFSFLVSDKSSKQARIIAMGGLIDIDAFHRNAELYIVVDPMQHGKGFGRRAIHWMCNWGFNIRNLERIYLYVHGDNQPARHLYEQLGFVEEGRLRKHHLHNGRYADRYIYGLLREEWRNLPWSDSTTIRLVDIP